MEKDEIVLDEIIIEFFNTYLPSAKLEVINNIIVTLHNLEMLESIDVSFDIPVLDDELVEIATKNDELPPQDLLDLLLVKLMGYFRGCLKEVGVIVTADISLPDVYIILDTIYRVLTMDKDATEEVLEIVNANEKKREILLEFINRYNDVNNIEIEDTILKVEAELLDTIREIFTMYQMSYTKEVNPNLLNKIKILITIDQTFLTSNYINHVIDTGEDNIEMLYKVTEEVTDVTLVAYEIYGYLYLKQDNKNIPEKYKDEIHIENIECIGNKTEQQNVLEFAIQTIDKKVKSAGG